MLELSLEKDCSFCNSHFQGEDLYGEPRLVNNENAFVPAVAKNIKYCPLCGRELDIFNATNSCKTE